MSLLIIESKILRETKSLSNSPFEYSQILIIIGLRVTSFGIYFHFEILTLMLVLGLPIALHYRLTSGASYLRHHFNNI